MYIDPIGHKKEILEIFFKDDQGIIQAYVEPVDVNIISEEIKNTFIQMPKVTNIPQSAQHGLTWLILSK